MCVCVSACHITLLRSTWIHLARHTMCLSVTKPRRWGGLLLEGARFWKVPPKSTVTTVDFRDRGRQNQPSPRLISEIGGDHMCSLLEGAAKINRHHDNHNRYHDIRQLRCAISDGWVTFISMCDEWKPAPRQEHQSHARSPPG